MAQALEVGVLEELGKKLDQLERPGWVRSIDTVEALDADDEWSVWIWMVVGEEMPSQAQAQPELAELRKRIRQLLREQAPGLWAYVRIREVGDSA